VIARSYNHTGPGRPEFYFESSVAKRFAEAKKAKQNSVLLNVGNIENIRDYSDVRDVTNKYLLLLSQADSGDIYNVCSGVGVKLSEIISILEEITDIHAQIEVDTAKIRKNDINYLVGLNRIPLESKPLIETIGNIYKYFLNQ
jgi:GDP-4-dehydro-6-deoxy-D-mannose reductase